MLLGELYVGRAAGSGHERLSLLHLLKEFLTLVLRGSHSALGHLHHIIKAHALQRAVHLGQSGLELAEHCRRDHGYHFSSGADALQHVESLRDLEYGSEGASVHAFTAIDAFRLVDMLYAMLILGDGIDGTCLLARNRDIDYGVVGTALVTDAATDALFMVDARLAGTLVETYCTFGTVVDAASRHASPAEIGDIVFDLHARRARLVDHAHYILLEALLDGTLAILTGKGHTRVFRQRGELIGLVAHVESEQRQGFIFPDGPFLVYTASSRMFGMTRAQLEGKTVDTFHQPALFPESHKLCEKTVAHNHGVVFISHGSSGIDFQV